jgi:hypothetical protein
MVAIKNPNTGLKNWIFIPICIVFSIIWGFESFILAEGSDHDHDARKYRWHIAINLLCDIAHEHSEDGHKCCLVYILRDYAYLLICIGQINLGTYLHSHDVKMEVFTLPQVFLVDPHGMTQNPCRSAWIPSRE